MARWRIADYHHLVVYATPKLNNPLSKRALADDATLEQMMAWEDVVGPLMRTICRYPYRESDVKQQAYMADAIYAHAYSSLSFVNGVQYTTISARSAPFLTGCRDRHNPKKPSSSPRALEPPPSIQGMPPVEPDVDKLFSSMKRIRTTLMVQISESRRAKTPCLAYTKLILPMHSHMHRTMVCSGTRQTLNMAGGTLIPSTECQRYTRHSQ
jgi:hypothetical protein